MESKNYVAFWLLVTTALVHLSHNATIVHAFQFTAARSSSSLSFQPSRRSLVSPPMLMTRYPRMLARVSAGRRSRTSRPANGATLWISAAMMGRMYSRSAMNCAAVGLADSEDSNDSRLDMAAASSTTSSPSTDQVDSNANDALASYRNKNNIRDQVVSALSGGGGIKVTATTVRNLMNDMMLQHSMTAVSAEALGRTVICSLLMANGIQDEQIVQISIKSEGPIRGVVAICTGTGKVRGYVGSPMLGPDLALEDAVGRTGAVQIVKNHPDWPRPYNGITAIRHGDIDRDIGIYLAESEQRSCALAAALSVSSNGILCKAAGGYLIEQLPGATQEEKDQVSENLAKLVELDGGEKLPTNLLLAGRTPLDLCELILDGLDMQPLQQIEPALSCDCSEDRLVRSLRLLPVSDVDDILAKQERVEARCEFCGTVYRLEAEQVREKLAQKVDGDDTNVATKD